jgi:hypothetical protein
MRPVPMKSVEQLILQALHLARQRLIGQRTAAMNQMRRFLLDVGSQRAKTRLVCARCFSLL